MGRQSNTERGGKTDRWTEMRHYSLVINSEDPTGLQLLLKVTLLVVIMFIMEVAFPVIQPVAENLELTREKHQDVL